MDIVFDCCNASDTANGLEFVETEFIGGIGNQIEKDVTHFVEIGNSRTVMSLMMISS